MASGLNGIHSKGLFENWHTGCSSSCSKVVCIVYSQQQLWRVPKLVQELQQDLHQVMNLEQQSAEYQLAVYAGRGSQYVKHRDALPDDGSDANQRRVSFKSDPESGDADTLFHYNSKSSARHRSSACCYIWS